MLINLTPEEEKQVREIQQKYISQLELLANKLTDLKPGQKEERQKVLISQQEVLDNMQAEAEAFLKEAQKVRFQEIEKNGIDAIIENAREQAPGILEDIYRIAHGNYKGLNAAALKEAGVGTLIDGKFLLNANYAIQDLKEELYLHIEALKDNKEAYKQFLEVIIEAVENSPLTDNSNITEIPDTQQRLLKVRRFRRNPLGDILNFGLMNDKATTQLIQDDTNIFTQAANGQIMLQWRVDQAPQKQNAVPIYLGLTYEGEGVTVTKKLTAFDKQVCEAVSTLFYYWRKDNTFKPLYVTPQEVWRTMNGKSSKDGKAKPSEKQVKRICDSIDKMRFTRFYMDISEEIKAFNLTIEDERIIGGRIETYIINSDKVEFETEKGNTIQGYRINQEPILYTYNMAKNHILFVPYEMLDTSDYTSDSENVAEFKNYLLQQIQLMKNTAEEGKDSKRFKRSNTVLIDTIYKDTGILPPEERIDGNYSNETTRQQLIRRTRKADRDKIEKLLEAWKAKDWIKDYSAINQKGEPLKEKQQAKGYIITI